MCRKPEDQRWSAVALENMQGTPWAPNPSKKREPREALELPEPFSIEVDQPEVEVQKIETSENKPHYRRVYLRQDDFDRLGYSAGCPACAKIRAGEDPQKGLICRLRMVGHLQETEYGKNRLKIAQEREELAKQEVACRQGAEKPRRISGHPKSQS